MRNAPSKDQAALDAAFATWGKDEFTVIVLRKLGTDRIAPLAMVVDAAIAEDIAKWLGEKMTKNDIDAAVETILYKKAKRS